MLASSARLDGSQQKLPPGARGSGDITPDPSWPPASTDAAGRVVVLVNQHRATIAAPPLGDQAQLQVAAAWKAQHMAFYRYMAHDDPAPPLARSWAARVRDAGYTQGYMGENVAMGYSTPEMVVQGWLNSPGHRANIENAAYSASGVGAARNASGEWYWAHDFGLLGPGEPGPPPPPPPPQETVEQAFLADFLPALQQSSLYANWRRGNPGEATRWDAYLSAAGGPPPVMATSFGRTLLAVMQMRLLAR